MSAPSTTACPLCHNHDSVSYHQDKTRSYRQCQGCQLVFVPPCWHLSPAAEREQYDLHQNNACDTGYQNFLNRVTRPLLHRLAPASSGLDFGSGPGPTLATLMQQAGHHCANYDIYYANQPQLLQQHYDFVTATEVVEHLRQPGLQLQQVWQCLKPGGWLAIMTKRVINRSRFASWHYINDPTHIAFFSEATFCWLARHWQTKVEFIGNDVALLQKPNNASGPSQ